MSEQGIFALPVELISIIVSNLSTYDMAQALSSCATLRAAVCAAWPKVRRRRFPMRTEDYTHLARRLMADAHYMHTAAEHIRVHTPRLVAEETSAHPQAPGPIFCDMRDDRSGAPDCSTEGSVAPTKDPNDFFRVQMCARCWAHTYFSTRESELDRKANVLEDRAAELQGAGLDDALPAAVLIGFKDLAADVLWLAASSDQDADDRISAFLECLALLKRDWPDCLKFLPTGGSALTRFHQLRAAVHPPAEVALFLALGCQLSGNSLMAPPDTEGEVARFDWALNCSGFTPGPLPSVRSLTVDDYEGSPLVEEGPHVMALGQVHEAFPTCCCEAGGTATRDLEAWRCVSSASTCIRIGHAIDENDVDNDPEEEDRHASIVRIFVCCDRQSRHWGQVLCLDPVGFDVVEAQHKVRHVQWCSPSDGGNRGRWAAREETNGTLTTLIERIHDKLHATVCRILQKRRDDREDVATALEELLGDCYRFNLYDKLREVPRHKLMALPHSDSFPISSWPFDEISTQTCLWGTFVGDRD